MDTFILHSLIIVLSILTSRVVSQQCANIQQGKKYFGRIFPKKELSLVGHFASEKTPQIHSCRHLCEGTANCTGLTYYISASTGETCKLHNGTSLKNYLVYEPFATAIILLEKSCTANSEVNGAWSQWTDETECQEPCPKVDMMEVRTCSDPYPSCNGDFCTTGINRRFRQCKAGECKGLGQLRDPHPGGIIYLNISSRRVPLKWSLNVNNVVWIPLQTRLNGSVSFKRNWSDYKHGFGSVDGEFWLGNEIIHALTQHGQNNMKLSVTKQGQETKVFMGDLSVGAESENYAMTVGVGLGRVADVELTQSFQWHSGQPFSTFDKDNDNSASVNCAHTYEGGWWFKGSDCLKCNLNGKWYDAAGGNPSKHGIVCQSSAAGLDETFTESHMGIKYV